MAFSYSLETEIDKANEEIKKSFNEISKEVTELSRNRAYLRNYDFFTSKLDEAIKSTLDKRLDKIQNTIKQISEKEAAKKLTILRNLMRKLNFFVRSQYVEHDKIPRNLYYLLDDFFIRTGHEIKYILSYDVSVAVLPFNQYLRKFRFNNEYPEFYKKITKGTSPFYFINIPPEFRKDEKALFWPVVLHEASHAIDQKEKIVHKFYPGVPEWIYELYKGVKHGDNKYKKKLWAMEFVADYLSTLVIGPYFAKILVDGYLEISRLISEHTTHPPLHIRIKQLLKLLNEEGFEEDVKLIENKLKKFEKHIESSSTTLKISNINEIYNKIKSNYKKFNYQAYQDSLKKTYPNIGSEELRNDFKDLKSVILNPSSLLTLITQIEQVEKDVKYSELFSDCIKSFFVSEKYKSIPKVN